MRGTLSSEAVDGNLDVSFPNVPVFGYVYMEIAA